MGGLWGGSGGLWAGTSGLWSGKAGLVGGGGGTPTPSGPITLDPDVAKTSGYLTLTDGNMAAVSAPAPVGALNWTWATRPGVPAKGYFEAVVNARPAGVVAVGYGKGVFLGFGDPDDGIDYSYNGFVAINTGGNYGGVNPIATYVPGDIIGVAYDTAAGRVYFAKNNVWGASSSPTAGTGGAVVALAGQTYYAGLGMYASTLDTRKMTIMLKAASQTYAPPTGYLPYDPTVGLTAFDSPAEGHRERSA